MMNDFDKVAQERREDMLIEVVASLVGERDALRAEVERLREERRWVCVHDRLPQPHDCVLTIGSSGEPVIAYLSTHVSGVWFCPHDNWKPADVAYWQPLPAPPEEEE